MQDPASSTYSYLLADSATRSAVLIDPVFEQAQRDSALLAELDLKLEFTLDTHVHADHITGAWMLKTMLGSRIAIGSLSGAQGADRNIAPGERLTFGERWLEARPTPGHTDGCMSYVLDDQSMVFTGDALLIRGAGRTDFQEGSASTLYHSVTTQLFTLPDNCTVYPAHDYRGLTASSIGEEKRFNPRLGGDRNESDFVGFMRNLGLAHPRQIDQAVPANQRCGRIPAAEVAPASDWAPLHRTYAGIDEIDPEWLAANRETTNIVDVREPDEFVGPYGHIEGATLMPLGQLGSHIDAIRDDKPIVTVCRSGGRSAQAYIMLCQAGRTRVANLTGGMIHWHELGLPVTRQA
jgi:glyoxylase-like metal-dependent hydrolase (beta-lactamase superfamily II)/rhodanese-related sulfurtransferase